MKAGIRTSLVGVLIALTLSACAYAPARQARTRASATEGGASLYGTIVAAHDETSGAATTDHVGAEILTALGQPPTSTSAGTERHERQTEFIVRADDGQTISVVQTNASRLVRGDRVIIVQGTNTRIQPAN